MIVSKYAAIPHFRDSFLRNVRSLPIHTENRRPASGELLENDCGVVIAIAFRHALNLVLRSTMCGNPAVDVAARTYCVAPVPIPTRLRRMQNLRRNRISGNE